MWIVIGQFEIFELEIKDVFDLWIQLHGWQIAWRAAQLQSGLVDVVSIEVRVPSE